MRCDYKVVRLFFTLHTQKQPLFLLQWTKYNFSESTHLIWSFCTCAHRQNLQYPPLSQLPSATTAFSGNFGKAYGIAFFSVGRVIFLKFNVLQGRCPVDKQREITVHVSRTLLEWSCHPVLPIFFQLSSSPLESNVFMGWQTAQAGYFAHILQHAQQLGLSVSQHVFIGRLCGEPDKSIP